MYQHIIFNFDGTIVDSDRVVKEIVEQLSREHNVTDSVDDFSSLSWRGKIKMIRFSRKVQPEIKRRYGEKIDGVKAIDEMIDLMESLGEAGRDLSILTTNSQENVRKFFERNDIVCDIPVVSAKGFIGKAKAIATYIATHRCQASDVLYVGDEISDVEASNRARVDIAYVTWGLDGESEGVEEFCPKYKLSTPEELAQLLHGEDSADDFAEDSENEFEDE